MQKIFSRVLSAFTMVAIVAISFVSLVTAPQVALADTIFSDNFGIGGLDTDVPDWEESSGQAYVDAPIGETASPDGGRFALIGGGSWICHAVTTSGYTNLTVKYYWRGDTDASNNEEARVEYASSGTCNSATWNNAASHELDDNAGNGSNVNEPWSTLQSASLPDGITLIRIRNLSSDNSNEHFRIDGVNVTGDTEAEPTVGDYSISQTGSAVVSGLTVDIDGIASAYPFVGQLSDQHISIDCA